MDHELDMHFRAWLRAGMTGCLYARTLASKVGSLAVEAHVVAPATSLLDRRLDDHAGGSRAAVFVFPFITSEQGLVELLNELHASSRWRVRRAGPSPSGAVLVGLEWTTARGDVSDTMGFAPFPHMPVPRRAPYVAIATWPGGRANELRGMPPTPRARPGQVSFLDAAHDLGQEQYERAWRTTEATIASLMHVPPDDARRYRRVAFTLSEVAAEGLAIAA